MVVVMNKPVISAGIASLIFTIALLMASNANTHNAFGLQVGAEKQSIQYPALSSPDLQKIKYDLLDNDSSSCLSTVFEELGSIDSYISRKDFFKKEKEELSNLETQDRSELSKKEIKSLKKKIKKDKKALDKKIKAEEKGLEKRLQTAGLSTTSVYWGRRYTIANDRNKGFDMSLNDRLQLQYYAVNSRKTCLIFFDNQLVFVEFRLNDYGMSQNFSEKYTDLANKDHGMPVGYPSEYKQDGQWRHGPDDWLVNFNNYHYLSASLQYTNRLMLDKIIGALIEIHLNDL